MNQLGIALVWCALQVTVLGCIATLVCLVLRRSSPALRSWTELLALLAVPCLTVLALCPVPSWFGQRSELISVASNEVESNPTRSSASSEGRPAPSSTDRPSPAAVEQAGPLADFAAAFAEELSLQARSTTSPTPTAWPTWLAWTVVALSCMGLMQLAIGWIAAHAIRWRARPVNDADLNELLAVTCARLRCRRSIRLLEVNSLTGAATFGLLRPVILLPADWRSWTTDERRMVLAHEVAHVVHGDYGTGLIAQLCLAVHFYHPLIHWLVAQLRLDQELSADAAAAAISGGQRNYLTTLAEMALRQDDRAMLLPAHMFLPTRRNFHRRIQMLRTWKALPAGSSMSARSLAAVILLLAVAAVAGLRSPSGIESRLLAQAPGAATPANAPAGFDTRFVSEDGGAVIAVRPARLLQNNVFDDVRKTLDEVALKAAVDEFGFHPADIDQVIVTSDVAFRTETGTKYFLRGNKPIDFSQLVKSTARRDLRELSTVKYGNATIHIAPPPRGNPDAQLAETRGFWMPDERTLVYSTMRHLRRYIDGDPPTQRLLQGDIWKKLSNRDAVVLADQESVQRFVDATRLDRDSVFGAMLIKPLIAKTRQLGFALQLGDDLDVAALALSRSSDDAGVLSESLEATRVLSRNMLRELAETADGDTVRNTPQNQFARDPITQHIVKLGGTLLDKMKIEQQDKLTQLHTKADNKALQLAVIAPAITSARTAARRTQSMNNLKQIGLAFHNYHDTYKHFPGAAAAAAGKQHPMSWRVAILPFVDQAELFQQYNQNEPWDSEHNRKLIAKMPPIYRHPDATDDATSASYFVLTGPDTIFRDDKPRIRDIHDGTSNTILAVEAIREIPWTKPEDIPFDKDKVSPQVGGYSPQGYNALFADGSVRFIAKNIDKTTQKLLWMSQDGQPVNLNTPPREDTP